MFELGPGLFDGVQVGRVRRQIKQLRACGLDPLRHAVDLVRAEVVHHHHISWSEGRAEEMVQVGEEDVRIGGRGDGHRSDHAAQAHRAQDGDDLPVSLRRPFVDARPAEAARKAPRHCGRDAAFVKEDQPFRIDREDALVELGATDTVGFGVSFDGAERLFSAADPAGKPTGAPAPNSSKRPEVICENERFLAGARDGYVAKARVEQFRVSSGVGIDQNAFYREALGAVARYCISVAP